MRIRHVQRRERPDRLQMSAMIDIVFLLLVFFVMTFTITAVEGDFNIEAAPVAKARGIDPPPQLPMNLRLTSRDDGSLAAIRLNDRFFQDFEQLHRFVLAMAAERAQFDTPLDDFVMDLDCDEQLDYKHVIDAITAVSGDLRSDGKRVDLLTQIRFR